jgi:CheY-like chemotaxis protein
MKTEIREILLAEDDYVTAHLVKTQLERLGFHVSLAHNGREALEIIHSKPVDLLITDVVMPEMDGVDLYLALKKNKATAALPVIISTDKQVFLESFSALGVDHFIPKFSDIEILIAKIREIGSIPDGVKNYRKVLVCGDQEEIIDQMKSLLQDRGCLVSAVFASLDVVSQALVMVPHIIILPLLIEGKIITKEIIQSLRCYRCLKEAAVVTFIQVPIAQCGQMQNAYGFLGDHISVCQEIGANKFLGRFN